MSEAAGATERPNYLSLDHIPFLTLLGVQARDVRDGHSLLELDQQSHHQNSLSMAHGGVVMTMLDVAMARAALSASHPDEAATMITIEMKTTFIKPATGHLRAEGTVVQRTSSLAFCEADLYNGDGALVARSSGTFKYLKRKGTK